MNFTLCTGSNCRLLSAALAVYLKSLFAHRLLYVFEGLVVIEEVLSTNHVHLEDRTERHWWRLSGAEATMSALLWVCLYFDWYENSKNGFHLLWKKKEPKGEIKILKRQRLNLKHTQPRQPSQTGPGLMKCLFLLSASCAALSVFSVWNPISCSATIVLEEWSRLNVLFHSVLLFSGPTEMFDVHTFTQPDFTELQAGFYAGVNADVSHFLNEM